MRNQPKIAVLIPCYNEQQTIDKVIKDFQNSLPQADIYVIDNCCTDDTVKIAKENNAVVIKEPRKGKGFAVEKMFSTIDADIYLMVDGDDTYPADKAEKLIAPIANDDADMVVGARLSDYSDNSFKPLHFFGNNLVRKLVNWMASSELTDIMSGYRSFNRNVAASVPVISSGFEVETEITIQALYNRLKIVEVQIPYQCRPQGSESKLNTVADGFRVLWKIFSLFRSFKPLTFFGSMGVIFFLAGLICGIPPVRDYVVNPNHYVEHIPLAILAVGLMLISAGSVFMGVLLHSLNWRFKEMHNIMVRNISKRKRV
jgi:glycosyltransferase involved in cell wall biosynthesis